MCSCLPVAKGGGGRPRGEPWDHLGRVEYAEDAVDVRPLDDIFPTETFAQPPAQAYPHPC